jgi:hypothetical protein
LKVVTGFSPPGRGAEPREAGWVGLTGRVKSGRRNYYYLFFIIISNQALNRLDFLFRQFGGSNSDWLVFCRIGEIMLKLKKE